MGRDIRLQDIECYCWFLPRYVHIISTDQTRKQHQLIAAVNDPLNALTCCKLLDNGVIIADASVLGCAPEITVYRTESQCE